MHVERPIYQNQLYDVHFQASKEVGMAQNPDFNDWSRSQEGYGEFQVAITARGRRADAYRQFLAPVLGRPNLTVVTRAQATKVHFEERGGEKVAVAVDVQSIQVRLRPILAPRTCR
jgi:choline dehydrogenase-like flavoprotein